MYGNGIFAYVLNSLIHDTYLLAHGCRPRDPWSPRGAIWGVEGKRGGAIYKQNSR